MYLGSFRLAISSDLLSLDVVTKELNAEIGADSFVNRRKLVAFKWLCQQDSEYAKSLIKDDRIRDRIWKLSTDNNLDDCSFETKMARIIWGSYQGKIETELLPYYVEADNTLTTHIIIPEVKLMMILESCVDVDRIDDILTYFLDLTLINKRLVIDRMITRFEHLKTRWPQYWEKCMYFQYIEFFRKFMREPDILNYIQIKRLQTITGGKFVNIPEIDEYQMLLYRCNQRTITRMLGISAGSNLSHIKYAIDKLRSNGVDQYYEELHNYLKTMLPVAVNTRNLLFNSLYEYHPDDIQLIQGYLFSGPEFCNLLDTEINPYTRQPLSREDIIKINMKIPQPSETMKELCLKYIR